MILRFILKVHFEGFYGLKWNKQLYHFHVQLRGPVQNGDRGCKQCENDSNHSATGNTLPVHSCLQSTDPGLHHLKDP